MNLPFGLLNVRDNLDKQNSLEESRKHLERKLTEYWSTIESYNKRIDAYMGKVEGYNKQIMDNQLNNAQTSLDKSYLNEQENKLREFLDEIKPLLPDKELLSIMEGITTSIADVNTKLDGVNEDIVNRISDLNSVMQKQYIVVLKQQYLDLISEIQSMAKKMKPIRRSNVLLLILFLLNLAGFSTLIYLLLYIADLLPF